MKDETLSKPITKTKKGKEIQKKLDKMSKVEKIEFEKKSEENYKKIMEMIGKK